MSVSIPVASAATSDRWGPWTKFLVRRLAELFAVLLCLVVASFLLVRVVPGDPARRVAGIDATAEQVEAMRESLGLNGPLHVQFLNYVSQLARLDFGYSFNTREPVIKVIGDRFPLTAQLAAVSILLIMAFAVPLGIAMGSLTREGRHRKLELVFMAVTGTVGALPEYLTATLLALVFAVVLHLLPVAGASDPRSVILPALAISLRPIATVSRIVRVETLNVLAQDYIRTARSKRLPERLIYFRHTMPNVMTAALTIGGLIFAGLLGGAVIVENVFAWPGLGTVIVQAVLIRDYPIVQGVTLLFGIIVVAMNTAVDVLIGVLDSRSLSRVE